MNHNY